MVPGGPAAEVGDRGSRVPAGASVLARSPRVRRFFPGEACFSRDERLPFVGKAPRPHAALSWNLSTQQLLSEALLCAAGAEGPAPSPCPGARRSDSREPSRAEALGAPPRLAPRPPSSRRAVRPGRRPGDPLLPPQPRSFPNRPPGPARALVRSAVSVTLAAARGAVGRCVASWRRGFCGCALLCVDGKGGNSGAVRRGMPAASGLAWSLRYQRIADHGPTLLSISLR